MRTIFILFLVVLGSVTLSYGQEDELKNLCSRLPSPIKGEILSYYYGWGYLSPRQILQIPDETVLVLTQKFFEWEKKQNPPLLTLPILTLGFPQGIFEASPPQDPFREWKKLALLLRLLRQFPNQLQIGELKIEKISDNALPPWDITAMLKTALRFPIKSFTFYDFPIFSPLVKKQYFPNLPLTEVSENKNQAITHLRHNFEVLKQHHPHLASYYDTIHLKIGDFIINYQAPAESRVCLANITLLGIMQTCPHSKIHLGKLFYSLFPPLACCLANLEAEEIELALENFQFVFSQAKSGMDSFRLWKTKTLTVDYYFPEMGFPQDLKILYIKRGICLGDHKASEDQIRKKLNNYPFEVIYEYEENEDQEGAYKKRRLNG